MTRPSLEYVLSRLSFDLKNGTAVWLDATKQHVGLNGKEAGTPRTSHAGKKYWHIKIDGRPYKRSHLVFLVVNGRWPDLQVDHIDGDSLNDRPGNLREVTATQNAWNHKHRAKPSDLPMGVRLVPKSGRYQARITCNKQMHHLGAYDTPQEAHEVYRAKREELFNEYA